MRLEDFYFADKHEAGTRMPIMLPSGEDSGEWLQVRGPDCDEAIKAGRAYTAAIRHLNDELAELEAKCKAKEDFSEYNDRHGWAVEDLNKQLALALVTGWSTSKENDQPFSKEAFAALLNQFRGLAEQVSAHHVKSRATLNAK